MKKVFVDSDGNELWEQGHCHDCGKNILVRWKKNWPVDGVRSRPSWLKSEGGYIKVCPKCRTNRSSANICG
jgi:hypothetical protein